MLYLFHAQLLGHVLRKTGFLRRRAAGFVNSMLSCWGMTAENGLSASQGSGLCQFHAQLLGHVLRKTPAVCFAGQRE